MIDGVFVGFFVPYLGDHDDIVAKCMEMRVKVYKDNKLQKSINDNYI